MKSVTLDNGVEYVAFWGGDLVKPSKNTKAEGEYSRIRDYHDVSIVRVDGLGWVHEYHEDGDDPHEDYKSMCGHYHIRPVFEVYSGKTLYKPYQCSTWRENLQSTFGELINGFYYQRFETFESAARAVARI
jgi:hypothetical protein